MATSKELYQGLRNGTIKKSQLNKQQIGEVYNYMVESNKISPGNIKPEAKKQYNIQETPKITTEQPKIYSPFKYQTNINLDEYKQKSTNPENELVDLLSNISMSGDHWDKPTGNQPISQRPIEVKPTTSFGIWDRPTASNIPTQPEMQSERGSGGRSGVTWQNNPLKAAGANISAGFGSLGRNTANVADMLGGSNVPLVKDWIEGVKKSSQYEDDRLAKINQTGGAVGEFAGSVFQGIGQSIPSMAMSLGSVPYAAANQIGKVVNPTTLNMVQQSVSELIKSPNMIPSLIQGVGSQYEQAISGGATKEQAIKSAIIGGIPSGLVEVLGGPENLTGKLASKMPFGRTVLESGLEEMFEEIIQYPIENLGQKIAYDKDMPLYSTTESALINPKEQLYSGASAFVSSALMGGASSFINSSINKLNDNFNKRVETLPQQKKEEVIAIKKVIDESLPQVYEAALKEDAKPIVEFFQQLETQYPELSEYLQGHLSNVDKLKIEYVPNSNQSKIEPIIKPTANENVEANQTLDEGVNFAQNASNDLTGDIVVSNTPTIDNQDNILQEVNNNVTEMQRTENIGYHAGDLGKADYLNIMPGRGTGHFGTGTYFVGNEKDIDIGSYKDRPRHTVSFEGYNLYKPKTAEEGIEFHSFLKNVNDMSLLDGYADVIDDIINGKVDAEYIDNLISEKFPYNSDFDLNVDYSDINDINDTDDIEETLRRIENKISKADIPLEVEERKRNIEQYQYFLDKLIDNIESVKQELKDKFNFSDEKIIKTIKELYQYGTSNLNSTRMDSPSTVFMKSLGYEGVDVRGIKGIDNVEFGSVIYDLKDNQETNTEVIAEPTTNEIETNEQIVKEEERVVEQANTEEKQTYRYYLTQRPPSPGTFPKGTTNVVSFDDKTDGAWGYVEYDKSLTKQQISDYELTENVIETQQAITGKTGIAKDNEGNAIEFVYEVVNANDLITSHTTELAVNNNYPSELQPRERTRVASQLQVNNIINNLQPDFLGENPKISDGSPIVGNDNIVESGNGRTIALTKMYQLKHDNQTKYVEWLKDNAETFGIDKDNLPDNPILVRKRTTEVDRADFVKKANESSIATMSATETARSDADKLTNESLTLFIANDNGIINTTENKGFIGRFISEVIPKNEQNKYITDKGELSQEGLARVRNAIFYKAYGDINLMNKLAENLDNNAKNITNTMLAVAPKVVDIKVNISKGNLHNVDYSSSIAQAANEYMALKESGKDIELYLQQESLFDNEDTALIKDITAIFNTNNRSVKRMSTIFNKLFDSVENLGNPNQINMFGETETPDRVSVLEETLRRLENEDNAQVTLFQSGREESSESSRSDSGEQGKTKGYKGGQSFTGATTASLVDMSRKLKKPTEIRKDITKKFNVPTSTKKFNRSKKYLGYYKVMPEVIRLKYDNDIGVVMHELGHHLDKKYGFNGLNKQSITDMINKMNPAFKKNYQANELPGEAIAEFLRYYTADPITAQEFAGDFYDLFEQTLNKQDLKNIQAIRSDVLRWVNAEREEKRQSTIVPISQKKNIGERISEVINFEKTNSILFDKYAPIQEFTKTVEKLTGRKLQESLNPHVLVERTYKNDALIEGLIKGQLKDTKFDELDTDDNLQRIVDDVGKKMTPFEDYLKLKHAITLAEKGHMIYSKDIYSNIEDMKQDLAYIEETNPEFTEQSERLYDWYDKFFEAWVVDTNMLGKDSKKAYETMREEYPYYVPMFRVREDGSIKRASGSLADQKTSVDRLSEKGSDRDTISPIDNIITQVSRMVNAYTKNNVMRAIVENYNTVDGLGGFIDRVSPDMERQIVSTQSIKDMIDYDFKINDNKELIDDIINNIPDIIENYKPLTVSKDQDIVGVIAEDGSRQFYQVFNKDFLNSLTNMNPTQLDATVKMIASVRRTTTALTTGLNPIFSIASNAPRDFAQAYVLGSYKNPAEYVYQYAKALINVATKTGNYKKFKEIGGVYGSSMTSELRNRNDFIRHLDKYRKGKKVSAKNALHYIGEMILDLNDAIETAPRLSEFNKAYKIAENKGMSEYDRLLYALRKSEDVTLNFARKGEVMNTAIGQSIPYLNAGLQGMDKLRRGFFTGEERLQTLIKALTMFTIPTILLWLAHKDDEDYERLSKGIKDNYWILWKKDDGSFFRMPKPKDLAAIFSSDFERALNAYFKEQGAGAFEGFQATIADSLLPPVDTIFRPLIDVAKNEKWSGSKIVGMSLDYLPKTEQYDETTSRIGVILAQAISKVPFMSDNPFASPKNVDYVLDQYYGGLADVLLPMATPNSVTTVEFIRRKFSADPSYSNDVVGDFYDLRDKTMKANNAYKNRKVMSDDVDFIAENQFKAYYKSISSMWKSIDYINTIANKNLPEGHKASYEKLIKQSRFADSEKQKVIDDLKDNKLNRESVIMLQKTVRDEIVKLAEKSVKEYKANHKASNEELKRIVKQE